MRVYRVAHRWHIHSQTGIPSGPYTFGWNLPDYIVERMDAMRWCHQDNERHPSPRQDDGIRTLEETEVCGFDSMEALERWFERHWRIRLHEVGYRVDIFEVPEDAVRRGRCQVVFDYRFAKRIGVQSLAEGCNLLHGGEDPDEDKLCTSVLKLAPGAWCRNPDPEDVVVRARRPRRKESPARLA